MRPVSATDWCQRRASHRASSGNEPDHGGDPIEYRYLGRSGLKISALSYGAWVTFGNQIGDDTATALMRRAYDAGINFFDNAEVYAGGQAEEVMGRILQREGWSRDSFLVSTKIFWGGQGPNQRGLSRKHIVEGTDAALRRLRVDYVDLIFCHRCDPHTPIEEVVRAMNWVIEQGKAFYWGTSEWTAQELTEAHLVARELSLIGPLMEQPQYSMLHRERFEVEYAPLYERFGLGTTVWSPLAGGLLTGKYDQGMPRDTRATHDSMAPFRDRFVGPTADANIERVRRLAPIARELGCSRAQLALAWCLKNPRVSTAITGASKPEHLDDNLGALDVLPKLTAEVMATIERALDNRPTAPSDPRG